MGQAGLVGGFLGFFYGEGDLGVGWEDLFGGF